MASAPKGGKFANGAITGAFVGLFNHAMHQVQERTPDRPDAWDAFESIDYKDSNDNERAEHILNGWKFSNDNGVGGEIPLDRIFTNLKCDKTLNKSGIFIKSANVTIDGKSLEVTIHLPLYNSTKHNQLLGVNVQFGGRYRQKTGTNVFQLFNNSEIIGVEGEDNFNFLLNWVGYD